MAEPVVLRPFTKADLAEVARNRGPAEDAWNFFGHSSTGGAERDLDENGLLGVDRGRLVVEVEGKVVGDVEWHRTWYGPPATSAFAFNIGISLLPEHRGRGYGSKAQRMLADYLFETYPVNRVEASTDIENVPEQRALARAGFVREGVLRGSQFRAGEWHDLVVYSLVRDDLRN